jgi:hypothetical protein
MARYLVVAHQTAASPDLLARLKEIAAQDEEAEFVLLVPVTPIKHLLTWVEGEEAAIAQARAASAAAVLRRSGLVVLDTTVGKDDPLRAIEDECRRSGPFAMAIISTLPPGISRWLRRDLPNRVRSSLGLQVEHVIAGATTRRSLDAIGATPADAAAPVAVDKPMDMATLASFRGSELHCFEGVVGQVRELLYDYVTQEPVWLGVGSRPIPFRTLLVPAGSVQVIDGRLTARLSKDAILSQPHVDIGEGITSLSDEEKLYQHYGLPFLQVRDVRVLRAGQELPGIERNWQNIFNSEPSETARQ